MWSRIVETFISLRPPLKQFLHYRQLETAGTLAAPLKRTASLPSPLDVRTRPGTILRDEQDRSDGDGAREGH